PVIYERWLEALQAVDPRFAFTDPPVRCSLPMMLAFAATASRPTGVLTGPAAATGPPPPVIGPPHPEVPSDPTPVRVAGHPPAALVWQAALPRPLPQMLFEIADSLTAPATSRAAELISLTTA